MTFRIRTTDDPSTRPPHCEMYSSMQSLHVMPVEKEAEEAYVQYIKDHPDIVDNTSEEARQKMLAESM